MANDRRVMRGTDFMEKVCEILNVPSDQVNRVNVRGSVGHIVEVEIVFYPRLEQVDQLVRLIEATREEHLKNE